MVLKGARPAATAGLLLLASFTAFAGEKEDAIIEKAIAAYGGKALLELKTLRINDAYKSFRRGQSRSPEETDQVRYQTSTTIDFENKRKSMQSYGGVYIRGLYVQHAFFDGNTGYRINHSSKTAAENPRSNFQRVDRGLSWKSDLALVKLLSEARAAATYKGQAFHRGRPHHLVSFQPKGYPAFTLLINKASGLLSKMTRPDRTPGSSVSYVFSDYRQQDGFTFAADTYVMRGGKPESLTTARSYEFNTNIDNAYQVPEAYSVPERMLAFADMSVNQVADGVFVVGKGAGFSVFVDAGGYLLAAGGYPGLTERFKAVQTFTGSHKPLKYQIVTHHHEDHIGGMKEAADLGATFIIASSHIDAVRAVAGHNLPDDRFLLAGKNDTYENGLVRVVDIATWHANHNLVTYIPHAKLAFSADHFFSFAESGTPAPAEMYAQFKAALDGFDLDIERFAAAHSGRVLTYNDLAAASTGPFDQLTCPADWSFCSNQIP